MKIWKHFTVVAISAIFGIVVAFTACDDGNGNGNKQQPKTFTVTFDADNGSPNTTQTVTEGEKATKPTNPTKGDYTFYHWFNVATDTEWDFDTPITTDISLQGKWSLVEMVHINAGTFTMGQTGIATPEHQVTLVTFYMGKYTVTQEQYQTVIGTNPSGFTTDPADGETQNKRPVEQVSWYDTLVFCNKLSISEDLTPAYSINGKTDPAEWGTVPTAVDATWDAVAIVTESNGYRLPTEAQWEYACRAGTTTAYNTGDTISDNTGWYDANSGNKTHEVGKKTANAWGLYDMHGNVAEWCWDWYGAYTNEPQTNPTGAPSGSFRVLRGGSWGYSAENVRSAARDYFDPDDRGNGYGFRLVRP